MGGVRLHYRQWLAWIVIVIIGYIAATYIVMGGLYLLVTVFPDGIRLTSTLLLWARVLTAALTLVIATGSAYVMKLGRVSLQTLGLSRLPSWGDIGLAMAGTVVYIALATALLYLARLLPFFDASESQELGSTMLFGVDRLLAFLALVVFVPFIEEVIFRGLLYGKLRQENMPFWPVALTVSVLFGVAHGQPNVAIDVFCMSMVACYLRNITGSIWAGVLLHMIKNAVAFMLVYVLMNGVGA